MDTNLGLLPVGYADGLPRAASGQAEIMVAEWATWAGTIEHKIVTGMGGRVHRQATGAGSWRAR